MCAAPAVKKAIAKPKKAKKSPAKKAAKGASKAKPAKKAKKDPNAPKRGLSAFMFFSQANRDSIKKKHPGCSFGEVGKYLGQEWAKAPAAVKAKHDGEAAKDKARYEAAMKKYKK